VSALVGLFSERKREGKRERERKRGRERRREGGGGSRKRESGGEERERETKKERQSYTISRQGEWVAMSHGILSRGGPRINIHRFP